MSKIISLTNYLRQDYIDLEQMYLQKTKAVFSSHHSGVHSTQNRFLRKNLCSFTNAEYSITCSSGTEAILLCLKVIGIKPGDEIITPAFSFVAAAEMIASMGAIPIFCDIREDFNIDPSKIEDLITEKTKAIIPVSLFGKTCDMKSINEIADKHSIPVIEDAAQSFGARLDSYNQSCSLSQYAITSFFPTKPFSTFGEGGAVFCKEKKDYQFLIKLSNHGSTKHYQHSIIGSNSRMSEIQAGILNSKFGFLPENLTSRREIAKCYSKNLSDLDTFTLPIILTPQSSTFAQYTVLINSNEKRDNLHRFLTDEKIACSIHYPMPIYQQPAFKEFFVEALPVTEDACQRCLSLPIHHKMPIEDVEYVCEKIISYIKQT